MSTIAYELDNLEIKREIKIHCGLGRASTFSIIGFEFIMLI
jgi:hypothetical protein